MSTPSTLSATVYSGQNDSGSSQALSGTGPFLASDYSSPFPDQNFRSMDLPVGTSAYAVSILGIPKTFTTPGSKISLLINNQPTGLIYLFPSGTQNFVPPSQYAILYPNQGFSGLPRFALIPGSYSSSSDFNSYFNGSGFRSVFMPSGTSATASNSLGSGVISGTTSSLLSKITL